MGRRETGIEHERLESSEQDALTDVYDETPEVTAAHAIVAETIQKLNEKLESHRELDDFRLRYQELLRRLRVHIRERPQAEAAIVQTLREVDENIARTLERYRQNHDLATCRADLEVHFSDIENVLPHYEEHEEGLDKAA